MLAEDCEDYVEVICRIGSLEILTGKAPTKELVICRIGSLEIFLVKILNSK